MNNFPYTNFHDLNLDWIIKKVKEYCAKVDDAITDFDDLKKYVDSFLDDIDYVSIINAKIDELIADGTMQILITSALNERIPYRHGVSNGTAQRIADVAQSYIRHNNDLCYMHHPSAVYNYSNGLQADGHYYGWNALQVGENVYYGYSGYFDDDTQTQITFNDEDGNPKQGYAINCTAFVDLIMLGVPYTASRYVAGVDNDRINVGKAGYCFNPWNGNVEEGPIPDADGNYHGVGLYGNNERMHAYFLERGMLELVANDASNVYPGDVIFWKQNSGGKSSIFHCGIVLHRYETSSNDSNTEPVALYAECVNASQPCKFAYLTLSDLNINGATNGVYSVAHPVYQECPQHANDIIVKQEGSASSMRWNVSGIDVVSSDLLTLSFTWKPSSSSEYINVQVSTLTDSFASCYRLPHAMARQTSANVYVIGESYEIVLPFIPRSSGIINGSQKRLQVIGINVVNGSGTNQSVITNCKLIKGLPGNGDKVPYTRPASLSDLKSFILGAFPYSTNHTALNIYNANIAPSSNLTVDGSTISADNVYNCEIRLGSSGGAIATAYAIIKTDDGDKVLSYASGTWSE